jgi:hypothetical protein
MREIDERLQLNSRFGTPHSAGSFVDIRRRCVRNAPVSG